MRVARLPVDLVEGVAAGDGEVAADGEGGVLVDDGVHELVGRDLDLLLLLYGRHFGASLSASIVRFEACLAAARVPGAGVER